MSFGWAAGDVVLLVQLAWNTVQNSRKACGEYRELTHETLRLHAVLQRLKQEIDKPDSPLNRPGDSCKEQLERIVIGCGRILKDLDKRVVAYAALAEEKGSSRKTWQKVLFGNGKTADLGDLRSKLTLYTAEMLFYVNLVSMDTVGRIEHQISRDRGVLRDIKIAVEKKTAHSALSGVDVEGSTWTSYADDETGFWRALRRELVNEGLPSAAIRKHKHLIKAYVKELGTRGVLDDGFPEGNDEPGEMVANREPLEKSNIELAASQGARDNPGAQDVDLQTLEDPQDPLLEGHTREIHEAKIGHSPPPTNPKTTKSEGSNDQSGTRSDLPSGRGRPKSDLATEDESSRSSSSSSTTRNRKKEKLPKGLFNGWAGKDFLVETPRYVQCKACLSHNIRREKSALLSCKHRWCNACLRRIFTLSTIDPQHMPPTCCSEECIDLKHVDKLFNITFKKKWNRKYQEFTTKNRIYCPAVACGSWIRPANTSVWSRKDDPHETWRFGSCSRCKQKFVETVRGMPVAVERYADAIPGLGESSDD